MADQSKGEPLGDTGITWGKSDDDSRTWWSGPQEGHSTTTQDGETVKSWTHSPNDARPNGFETNTSTGTDTNITDGKKS